MAIAYLLVGSNMGDKISILHKAVERLQQLSIKPIVASSVYKSEPWGFKSQEWFLNSAVKIEIDLEPLDLLDKILEIEKSLGRERNIGKEEVFGYSSRTLDIDILLYENLVINTTDLQVPHPRMHLRRFVLLPLCEIASEIIHPTLNLNISRLLEKCEDSAKVYRIDS